MEDCRGPASRSAVQQLTAQIASGVYQPGQRLPSVREFAADAGVDPNTMQRALTDLESKGLIITNRTQEGA